jgi:alkanesulfonate monooxygenase SsuD/methylene tetrahydromethanopterin reductase-like flavin-dependent oxidoreductase (luciferase family)
LISAASFCASRPNWTSRAYTRAASATLLRALWTSDAVTFNGREHHIDGAGLNPLPVQRPIPQWVGGGVRATVRRAARYGDGWIAPGHYVGRPVDDEARQLLGWLHEEAQAAGRRPEELGVQGVIGVGRRTEDEWAAWAESWRSLGATDLLIDTGVTATSPDPSLNTAQSQIQTLRRLAAVLGVG